jgi:hypothetical protein
MENLDPIWILSFDHYGYIGSDSIKWIGDMKNTALVDFMLFKSINLIFVRL